MATSAAEKSGGKLCCWEIVVNALQQISPQSLASFSFPGRSVSCMDSKLAVSFRDFNEGVRGTGRPSLNAQLCGDAFSAVGFSTGLG
jgi:hypothetical protein